MRLRQSALRRRAFVLRCFLAAAAFFAAAHAHARTTRPGRAQPRAPTPAASVSSEGRRSRVLEAFAHAPIVRRCWARQLDRDPTTPTRVLRVTLSVDVSGRTRGVSVRDPRAPELATCISGAAAILPDVGPGAAFEAVTTLTLEPGR